MPADCKQRLDGSIDARIHVGRKRLLVELYGGLDNVRRKQTGVLLLNTQRIPIIPRIDGRQPDTGWSCKVMERGLQELRVRRKVLHKLEACSEEKHRDRYVGRNLLKHLQHPYVDLRLVLGIGVEAINQNDGGRDGLLQRLNHVGVNARWNLRRHARVMHRKVGH